MHQSPANFDQPNFDQRRMTDHAVKQFALLMLLTSLVCGCATLSGADNAAEIPKFATAQERLDWWKSNRHRAEFVPGKGFALAGFDGYFDDQGRPMDGGVRTASHQEAIDVPEEIIQELTLGERLDPIENINRIKQHFTPDPDLPRARRLLAQGHALFKEEKYKQAAEKYETAAELSRESATGDDAQFMFAECLFFANDYPEASTQYDELVKQYPSTPHIDKAMSRQFAIARYWEKHHQASPRWPTTMNLFDDTRPRFDTRGHALRVFENIRLNDPTGPLADDAIMAIANVHFLEGNYLDADYNYGLLRKEYPNSDHQFQAHLLGMQCKLRLYQGADYEGAPLEEADKLADQLLKQFPDRITKERENVLEQKAEIARLQALRDWNLASYFDYRRQFGAARYYYNEVVRAHPTTKLASQARDRLGEISDQPDGPPQQIAWLMNLFPDSEQPTRIAAGQPAGSTRR